MGSEQNVLHDRELVEHLSRVHFDEAGVDFGPGWNHADVPKLIGVLGERAALHRDYVLQAAEEQIVVLVLLNVIVLHEPLRLYLTVACRLKSLSVDRKARANQIYRSIGSFRI